MTAQQLRDVFVATDGDVAILSVLAVAGLDAGRLCSACEGVA